ncbi:hypothetical protein [Streptomyces sp. ICBB 8177]|uniref:hypothetical protein n=1 Tax=Streptomyces sp. ICBB 8177 TaxID=563922 RepID=UPI000D67C7A0|nr:hypothetical protein [Streptomyces sp. ICBB 8177]PWI45302.1 hypothetical protein CK485_03905 [Streptomyces sp. ICBB 8177]
MRAPALAATAAAVLALPLLAACSGSSSSTQDCPTVAHTVRTQVAKLDAAVRKSATDPRDAATVLRQIQTNLDDIAGHTGDSGTAASKAVGDLSLAVSNVKNELDKGQPVDVAPIDHAASELTTACPKK